MSVSYLGYDAKCITMEKSVNSNIEVGNFICLDDDGYHIKKCLDGESFIGIVKCVRDKYITVQIAGYCEVPYSGLKEPTVGHIKLNCGNNNNVILDASAQPNQYRTILKLDTKNKIIGFLF